MRQAIPGGSSDLNGPRRPGSLSFEPEGIRNADAKADISWVMR
jgi:hypothetical protein